VAGPTVRKAVEYFFAEIAQLPDGTLLRLADGNDHR
jgi:hypothetical protein